MTSLNNDKNDATRSYFQLVNNTLIGHYRIIEKIGAGGMGEVYLAEDASLKRKVAIKFLSPHLCQDEECRARFKREAQAIAQLDHPNIVTVHEVGEFQGRPFFAMYYVEGLSLKEKIAQKELTVEEILGLARGICEGLQEAHKAGIIHRDIKPGNILVQKDGKAKIVDFGLAAVAGATTLTQPGSTLGTLSYMSPEQIAGSAVDVQSDLFSLGVVLYEMIAGRLPFRGEYQPAIAYAILYESPDPLAQYRSATPEGLQQIISRLLEKTPTLRYQTAADVIDDLRLLEETGSLAGGAQRAAPGRHRRRVVLILIATAALIVSAVIIKLWRFEISADLQPEAKTNRLAVLYLKNLGTADDEYLSYGITEDLIVDLTRLGMIAVTPMRSVMKFRDSDVDPKEIASQLNVNLILDGSIHKMGGIIRISVQLINMADGTNLWADRWEETNENLPRIKEGLASGIGRALKIDTTTLQLAQVGSPEGHNAVAYDYYLRAKYAFDNRTAESDVDVALGLYRKSLELEPSLLVARIGAAEILSYKGEPDRANNELLIVLSEARSQKLKADEVRALTCLAKSYENHRVDDKALRYADTALQLAREAHDLSGELEALWIQRGVFQRQRDNDQAIGIAERMIEILHQLNDQEREAEALKHMGAAYFLKGEYEQALPNYRKGLILASRFGKKDLEASIMHNMSMCFEKMSWADSSLLYSQRALQLYTDLGDKASMADELYFMGVNYCALGEYRAAGEHYQDGADIYKGIGDQMGYTLARHGAGAALMNIGQYDSAILILQEALAVFTDAGDSFNMASTNADLGLAYTYMEEPARAKPYLYEAIHCSQVVGDTAGLALHAWCLAEYCYLLGCYDSSRHYSEMALTNARMVYDTSMELLASAYLAANAIQSGGSTENIVRLRKVLADIEKRKDAENAIIAGRLLGQMLVEHGVTEADHRQGRNILQDALSLAKEKELAHEIKRIGTILEKQSAIP
jgi:TolB-like protein/tRNA A-37 threonylcarbamoyl transferase component Bud32